jgi:deoxyribodipyrimidine photolyase
MMLDHAHTGPRGSYDRRTAFGKALHKIQRHGTCFLLKSIIEERLSAAGLFGREDQFYAKTLQDTGHILKCRGIELVTETGNEKLGF